LISIVHKTCYSYDRPVFLSPHLFRLAPYAYSSSLPVFYSLNIDPVFKLFWQQDVYGNKVAGVNFGGKLDTMSVEVHLDIDIKPHNPFDFMIDQRAQIFPFLYPPRIQKALLPYLRISEDGLALTAFVEQSKMYHGDILGLLAELTKQIYGQIQYSQRFEEGVQRSEETLVMNSGSCRDSAWLLVEVLRHLGLASRFVSGYLIQLNTATGNLVDLHAWAEVFIPGAGWIGLDTTSGLFTGESHIALAVGPTPDDVAPVEGTTDPCISTMSYYSNVVIQ
jgi:transglutaminase-like putative cysteine protease